jgi:hypothetical protein
MSRKLFVLVGHRDDRVITEALKKEHGFDRVIGLSLQESGAFRVDYYGALDGFYLESKEDEHRGALSDWVASSIELNDVVYAKMSNNDAVELLASGQLLKVDFLFVDVASEDVVQYALDYDVKLVQRVDVVRWLQNRKRTLPRQYTVVHAKYGTEKQSANVTQALIDNLARAKGQVQVSNNLCGCDPHFGVGKMLSIDYEADGARHQIQAWEGTYVFLS